MPTGYARIAKESIPGNETNSPTLGTKKIFPPLISIGPKKGPAPMSRDNELRNQDEPLPVISEAYNPSWDLTVRAYPDILGYLFWLALGDPVTTAGNGVITDLGATVVPVGAYRHTWTAPFGPTGASPYTAQLDIAYSDQGIYWKGKGAGISELSIETPESGGAMVSCSGPVNYLDTQSNPSLTPTYESLAIRPFTRSNLTLPTNLAGTAVTEDFTVSLVNPMEQVRSLGIASKYPDVLEKDNEGPITFTGTIPKRQLDQEDIDALEAATGFALLAQWVNDSIIASGYPYKLFVSCSNAQYVEGEPDELMNRRRHGHSFSWKSSSPSTGSTVVQVVNATTTYT